jgi:hypothetical protein
MVDDDESGVLEVLEFILSDAGYTVVSALNRREAWLASKKPTWVNRGERGIGRLAPIAQREAFSEAALDRKSRAYARISTDSAFFNASRNSSTSAIGMNASLRPKNASTGAFSPSTYSNGAFTPGCRESACNCRTVGVLVYVCACVRCGEESEPLRGFA